MKDLPTRAYDGWFAYHGVAYLSFDKPAFYPDY
jgi:hypothetical protein